MAAAPAQPALHPRTLVPGGKGIAGVAIEDLLRQQEQALRLSLELSRRGGAGQWGDSDEDTDSDGEAGVVDGDGDDEYGGGGGGDDDDVDDDDPDGYAVLLLLEHAQGLRTLASLLHRTRLRCRHSASLEAAMLLSDALGAFSRCAATWEEAAARRGDQGGGADTVDPEGNLAYEIAATANSLALLLQTSAPGLGDALRALPPPQHAPPGLAASSSASSFELRDRGGRRRRRWKALRRQSELRLQAACRGGGALPSHGWDPAALYAHAEEKLIQLEESGSEMPQLWSFVLCSHAWLLLGTTSGRPAARADAAGRAQAVDEAAQLYGHALAADPEVASGDKLGDHYCEELGVLHEAKLARRGVELLREHVAAARGGSGGAGAGDGGAPED